MAKLDYSEIDRLIEWANREIGKNHGSPDEQVYAVRMKGAMLELKDDLEHFDERSVSETFMASFLIAVFKSGFGDRFKEMCKIAEEIAQQYDGEQPLEIPALHSKINPM